MGPFLDRFLRAFGSPNHVGHSSICADGSPQAHWATQGFKAYAGYDWDNTNYILCFGGGFIEAWRPTTRLLRAYGHIRRGRPVRGKIVQIDPRFSITASKADEWIPIKPCTDGALALGIAHVILREELYDETFVQEHTFGFDDWTDDAGHPHTGWRNLVLNKYPPEQVSQITEVPAGTIVRLAREFATTKPAVSAGERGASMQVNGVYNRMAIHALNALVGSIDTVGGVMVQRGPPFAKDPDVAQDEVAQNGVKQPRIDYAGTKYYPLAGKVYQGLPDFVLGRRDPGGRDLEAPYPLNVLLTYYTNPLFSSPDVGRFYEMIDKIPLVISFSPFIDETTAMADYVLPDQSYLERWHDDVIYPSLGYPVVGLRQPVVDPLYDAMDTGTVLIKLAQALGGTVADSFPWADFREYLQFKFNGIFESQTGYVGTQPVAQLSNVEEFWNELTRTGVWLAPPYKFGEWEKVLTTPSKRFEFFSLNLFDKLEHLAEDEAAKTGTTVDAELEKLLVDLRITARGDEVFMPHYEPPRFVGDSDEYPLYFITYKLMAHAEGRGANVPNLQEILGPHLHAKWDSWVEINPETARRLGIAEGSWVWVESPISDERGNRRRIRTRARLYEGARPDSVFMPFELGHREYGRWAAGRGANPNWILANEYDLLGGLAAFSATRVKVYPAGGDA
jgi:anaerobic selenocysteine-containing dehydrogenase